MGVHDGQAGNKTPEEHAAAVAEFCKEWTRMWQDHFRAVHFGMATLGAVAYAGVILLSLWIAKP